MTLAELLEAARSSLDRVGAGELYELVAAGRALVLDSRTPTDRELYGCIPGSIHTPRTVLEWRIAMDAPLRIAEVTSYDQLIVVVCNEGLSSSLAASTLQTLGFHRATDLIGGVLAWRDAGLPLVNPSDDDIGVRCDSPDTPIPASI